MKTVLPILCITLLSLSVRGAESTNAPSKPATIAKTPLQNVDATIAENKLWLTKAQVEVDRRKKVWELAGKAGRPQAELLALRNAWEKQLDMVRRIEKQIPQYELQPLRFVDDAQPVAKPIKKKRNAVSNQSTSSSIIEPGK